MSGKVLSRELGCRKIISSHFSPLYLQEETSAEASMRSQITRCITDFSVAVMNTMPKATY